MQRCIVSNFLKNYKFTKDVQECLTSREFSYLGDFKRTDICKEDISYKDLKSQKHFVVNFKNKLELDKVLDMIGEIKSLVPDFEPFAIVCQNRC